MQTTMQASRMTYLPDLQDEAPFTAPEQSLPWLKQDVVPPDIQ